MQFFHMCENIVPLTLLPYSSFCLQSPTYWLSHIYEIHMHVWFFHIYLLSKNLKKLSKDLITEHSQITLLLLLISWWLINNKSHLSNILSGALRKQKPVTLLAALIHRGISKSLVKQEKTKGFSLIGSWNQNALGWEGPLKVIWHPPEVCRDIFN